MLPYFEGHCSTEVFPLLPKEGTSKAFLRYWLIMEATVDKINATCTGSRMPRANVDEVMSFVLRAPSLKEQERIVAILDEAFKGIATAKANAEKNLQNARNIFIHHLETVFNRKESEWINKSISELAEYSLGKMLDKQKNRGELRPYLRNVNVRWFDFDLSDVLEMRFLPSESDKYRVSAGDVVICEGGYPGRAAIWIDDDPMYFQKALHRVRFHEPTNSKWFVFYLYSQSCTGRLKQHFTGSGIQHFTGAALARFVIPVAPKKQMIELLKVMEELQEQGRNLEAVYQNKLALLETLKQSLLHQAFTGKL
jgi:type I restriction enzyme S subunit